MIKIRPSDYLKQGWCQAAYAKDIGGQEIDTHSSLAVSWCFAGAISRAFHFQEQDDINDYIYKAEEHTGGNISAWNDFSNRAQQEVVDMALQIETALWGEKD